MPKSVKDTCSEWQSGEGGSIGRFLWLLVLKVVLLSLWLELNNRTFHKQYLDLSSLWGSCQKVLKEFQMFSSDQGGRRRSDAAIPLLRSPKPAIVLQRDAISSTSTDGPSLIAVHPVLAALSGIAEGDLLNVICCWMNEGASPSCLMAILEEAKDPSSSLKLTYIHTEQSAKADGLAKGGGHEVFCGCPTVAAWEGLVGLHLETGQDVTSSVLADECLQLLKNTPKDESRTFKALHLQANAVKGLADLVTGDLTSGNSYFGDNTSFESQETRCCTGNIALSHGEFLHASGKLSAAEEFYQKALKASETKDFSDATVLAAGNMVSEKVSLGASCALGQLLTHLGNFQEAEEILTKALTKAETHFGSYHPNVGVVLTCIAMMFGHKARLERSSSLLIQEGLYRRALDLLKAPSLDTEVTDMHVDKRDIVALARGGYAQTLSVQQYRKEEGERMRKWAESIWRNCRLSLAEALEISEPSKVTVIDARINRAI